MFFIRPGVYIDDYVNRCVKRFDPHGRLLMRTPGRIKNIQFVAVDDSNGDVVVLHGAAMDKLSRFTGLGRLLWEVNLREAMPPEDRQRVGNAFWRPSCGPAGVVYVPASHRGTGSMMAQFDVRGSYRGIRDGDLCSPSGQIYSFARLPGNKLRSHVKVSDPSRSTSTELTTQPLSSVDAFLTGAERSGFYAKTVDAMGRLHAFAQSPATFPVDLAPGLRVCSDEVVVCYDEHGAPTARLRFPGSPCDGWVVTADRFGNVYHLAFGDGRIDVVRYATGSLRSVGATCREIPSDVSGGILFVPLKAIAAIVGATVEWNADTHMAALVRAASDRAYRVVFSVADGAVLRSGEVWVPAATCVRAGVRVMADPQLRVAYVATDAVMPKTGGGASGPK
jgi:hypothetical protein